ncbi:MAG: hypothetical protein WC274_07885 [Sulfurimonas sp.]|jgi:hypothetical protein
MRYDKLILVVLVPFVFQACVANKNLSDNEVFKKAMLGCPNPQMTIITLPSRGLIADAMAITAIKISGNDGGFSQDFSTLIKSEPKNVSAYCPNLQKLEATLLHTFSLYQENRLKGVSVCVIGMSTSQELTSEAARTGAALTLVP